MGVFTLKIRLGNVAMQTPRDVADALRRHADRLEVADSWGGDDDGPIMDTLGNKVGSWAVQP